VSILLAKLYKYYFVQEALVEEDNIIDIIAKYVVEDTDIWISILVVAAVVVVVATVVDATVAAVTVVDAAVAVVIYH
jgi:hypothetical protein